MENQVHLLSLNRAGPGWGNSIMCPPAMDEAHQPIRFGQAAEFRYLSVTRQEIDDARRVFPFRADLEKHGGTLWTFPQPTDVSRRRRHG